MKNFTVLKILDKFQFIYVKLGVNYKVMRMILKVKLTMDGRRVSNVMGKNKKSGESRDKNNYLSLLMFNAFISIFIGLIMNSDMPAMKATNIVIGINLFMMISLMISDFSAVLLDVTEKSILLPKPIDNKTFNAAKTTHICIYLAGLTLSLNLIPLVIGTIKYGALFFVIFFIENILSVLIVITLTSLLYTIVLKFFDGEKLKDIINYFQILLAFVFAFGYQLVARVFNVSNMNSEYIPKLWHVILPSMWFAAPFGILIDGNKQPILMYLLVLAVVGPIVLIVLYFKKVVPYFEKNLQKLNAKGGTVGRRSENRKEFIAGIVCKDNIEKSMFKFTQNMIATERSLKLKVYPTLAMAVFMPVLFVFMDRNDKSLLDNIQNGFGGKIHLLIYISIFLLCFCTAFINNSDSFKGAFIYKVLPIENPGVILKGAVKGTIFKLIIPLYLLDSIVFLILKGPLIIIDLVVMFLVLLILSLVYFKLSNKAMPFSVKFATTDSGKLIMPSIVTSLLLGIFAGIHIAIRNNIIFICVYGIVLLIANVILWKTSFNVSWKDIEM
ncbi:ABC transporter permease [Clostridium estertheticum]|uniref:ABC transporter permease n=1 Tax=Clostridium estertheticum TaxID=238834 RepID=UPI001CF52066|nr:ABC transporter permease [Clostridium estertheticum]MCB2309059.1 ABC transporter permease [Clostridium estertheticum]MCB2352085.1 ABC transporter permease [Clostridium estertheticum]WAG45354.1 ABC transporter permease [Clostridium estertheticum]